MEYRRRRRRRGTRNGGSGAGGVVLAIVLVAGMIYFVTASSAGTWIAQNVVAPLFGTATHSPDPSATPDDNPAINSGDLVTREIDLPSISCYMLQMGAFESKENAEKLANDIKDQGAAGYVYQDSERFRVLASGYGSESDAKSVRDRLKDEGHDCTVFNLAASGASFRVTATEAQLNNVESGFKALLDTCNEIMEASISFDENKSQVSEGKAAVGEILTKLKNAVEPLKSVTSSDEVLLRVIECYDRYSSLLSALSNEQTESFVDFSSKMKYTQLQLTHEYVKLMEALSSQG